MSKIHLRTECAGYFTVRTKRPGMPWRTRAHFPNLITNWGLDRMGANDDWLSTCYVGNNSTAPSVNDTALGGQVAKTANRINVDDGVQSTAPYFHWSKTTFEFAEGDAAGNLTEVAVGANSGADYAFSRALFKDGNGDPTTVTVLAQERLQVIYEFRLYAPTVDTTGTVMLRGTTHSYTGRASNVTSNIRNGGWGTLTTNGAGLSMNYKEGAGLQARAYDGDIDGSVTSSPSGAFEQASTASSLSYSPGSYQTGVSAKWETGDANFASLIKSFRISLGIPTFQVSFDPRINKTELDELTLEFIHSWARKS